jgi:hypothetical protein
MRVQTVRVRIPLATLRCIQRSLSPERTRPVHWRVGERETAISVLTGYTAFFGASNPMVEMMDLDSIQ